MKKNIFTNTLAVVTLLFGMGAKAEENYVQKFSCTDGTGQLLKVSHLENSNGQALANVIFFEDARIQKHYSAIYTFSQPGHLGDYKIYSYELFENENKVGTLKISISPFIGRGGNGSGGGSCRGRAPCDFSPAPVAVSAPVSIENISAQLSVLNYEVYFSCH